MNKPDFLALTVGDELAVKAKSVTGDTVTWWHFATSPRPAFDKRWLSVTWKYLGPCTPKGKATEKGASARLWSPELELEIAVHHWELRRPSAAGTGLVNTATTLVPPSCDPKPPPWQDNVRVGALFVDREPAGSFKVSAVEWDGERWKQILNTSGVQRGNLDAVVRLAADRLIEDASRGK